jgi:hypothetical protein
MHQHPLLRNRSRVSEIARWEAKYQLKLPAALREWYEMEGADLWQRVLPRDNVIELKDLEPMQPAWVRGKSEDYNFFCFWAPSDAAEIDLIEPVEHFKYLLFFADTDCGIPCVIRVDGSDDPPMFIKPEGENDPPLRQASQSFSALVFDRLADGRFSTYQEGCIVWEANHRLPSDEELSWLRTQLSPGPGGLAHWFGWEHRFSNEQAFVACGLSPYEENQPIWTVRAFGQERLMEVLTVLKRIDGLVEKLTLGYA